MTIYGFEVEYESEVFLRIQDRLCQDYSSYLRSPETYDECLGDFDKKVIGKHCYPHWHKKGY